jgi:hypothetical protein
VTTLIRTPIPPDASEPTTPGSRVEDGEGGVWTLGTLYGDRVWYGPNTAIAELRRVTRVQPVHLLEVTTEIVGQEALFGDVTG